MSYPYIPTGTTKRFRIPSTLAADFSEFLQNDVPNQVMDFELVTNWFDRHHSDYTPKYIRGEIYADSTKSRYTNTDNNMNFRAAVDSGIKKGDMIVQPDGTIFILDWFVALESNNAPSRALRCNMKLNIQRRAIEVTDEAGFLLYPEGWQDVVGDLPANAYRYDGRPEYTNVAGTPGTTPNALTLITVQFNEQTRCIRDEDRFVWGEDTYTIIDIDRQGVDLDETSGTLKLQARKTPGGLLYED